MQLNDFVDYLVLFINDLKVLHFYAEGKGFKRNHETAEELYTEMETFLDDFSEIAISQDEIVGNFSTSAIRVEDWNPVEVDDYENDEFVENVFQRGEKIKRIAQSIIDGNYYNSFVVSKLDDLIAYLNKEISYKIKRQRD